MDISTVIGLVATLGLISSAILMGGSFGAFIDVPSILIVVGGTIFVTFINYPLGQLKLLPKIIKFAFFVTPSDKGGIIKEVVEMAQLARKKGLLSIESALKEDSHALLKLGLELVVDGHEAKDVDDIMNTELESMKERHRVGAELFSTMAMYSPAMGLIGTLIGLVQMLKNLEDPSSIGPAMAVALLTTFYGSILANVIFTPLAGKLKSASTKEEELKVLIITGVLAILSGDNPRIIEQKMNSFLPSSEYVDTFGAAGGE